MGLIPWLPPANTVPLDMVNFPSLSIGSPSEPVLALQISIFPPEIVTSPFASNPSAPELI